MGENVADITVLIPLGPQPEHAKWLGECLCTVANQTVKPAEVLIVDDMHGLTVSDIENCIDWLTYADGSSVPLRVWRAPWHLGIAACVNIGVMEAANEHVILCAADDKLLPECVSECDRARASKGSGLHYYYFHLVYNDPNNDDAALMTQNIPSGPAMVTKSLWRATGGYRSESAVGNADSTLVGIITAHFPPSTFVSVGREPIYFARMHEGADHTQRLHNGWSGLIDAVKNLSTDQWTKPTWRGLA